MKTAKGIKTYGCFNLGFDEKLAKHIFNLLQGERETFNNAIISMDLTKRRDGIPFRISILRCNFNHLANNVKIIAKEIFKDLNIE